MSAVDAEKNGTLPTNGKNLGDLVEVNKKCPPQTPKANRSKRKNKYNASSGKENERQTPVRESRGKLVGVLLNDQPRASSCRDNLQKPVAPRRHGS